MHRTSASAALSRRSPAGMSAKRGNSQESSLRYNADRDDRRCVISPLKKVDAICSSCGWSPNLSARHQDRRHAVDFKFFLGDTTENEAAVRRIFEGRKTNPHSKQIM